MRVTKSLEFSRYGYYLFAVRDDDDAAKAAGINPLLVRTSAMALSASLTGIGGSLFAQYFLYLDPTFVISPELSFQFALLPAVGGLGTAIGPVLGSFLITPLSELLRSYLGSHAAGLASGDLQRRADRGDALFPGRACGRAQSPGRQMEALAVSALLEVRNVSRSFGALWAVRDVSFAVQKGELLGLIGPNGAGKSTLYNLIAGVLRPTRGSISCRGQDVTGWPAYKMARVGVARTFQIPKPYRQISVIENVMLSAFLRERSIAGARALAEATLADVGLADYVGAPIGTLTVGLLKRLEVARALAMRPRLVLFDEIMAGLTPTEVGTMTQLRRRTAGARHHRGLGRARALRDHDDGEPDHRAQPRRGDRDRGAAGGGARSRGGEGLSRRGDGPCLR